MPLTKKGKNMLLGGSMVFMAGSLAWLFLPSFLQDTGKPASQLPVPKVEKKLGDRTVGQPKSPSTPAQKSEKGQTGERVQAALNDSGTRLGDLARMRGQKHLLEQEVKIAELQRQLREAQTIAPVVPQPQEIVLPPLEPPKREKPSEEKDDKSKRPSGPVVISVQGVGNRLSATIRTSSGETVTVRHGQRFGGGVLSVTRRSVTIRSGSTSRDIPFME